MIYFSRKIPKDSLDIVLTAEYDHSKHLFVGKNEVLIHKDTDGQKTNSKRLRNTIDVYIPPPIPLSHPLRKGKISFTKIPREILLDLTDGSQSERSPIENNHVSHTVLHGLRVLHGF